MAISFLFASFLTNFKFRLSKVQQVCLCLDIRIIFLKVLLFCKNIYNFILKLCLFDTLRKN